jgi:hypothetical protein
MTTVNVPKIISEQDGLLDFAPPAGKTVVFDGTISGAGQVKWSDRLLFYKTYTYSGRTTVNKGTYLWMEVSPIALFAQIWSNTGGEWKCI